MLNGRDQAPERWQHFCPSTASPAKGFARDSHDGVGDCYRDGPTFPLDIHPGAANRGVGMLFTRALLRPRDYVYPAAGAACIIGLFISSFANDGHLALTASLAISVVCGLALAQSQSSTNRRPGEFEELYSIPNKTSDPATSDAAAEVVHPHSEIAPRRSGLVRPVSGWLAVWILLPERYRPHVMFTALKAPPADDPVNSARIFDSFCKRGHRLARQHLFFRVFRSEFAAQPASVLLICLNKIGFVLRKCRQHKPGLPIVLHLLLAISRNALSRRTAARDQVWPVAGSVARLRRCAPALARPSWSRCRGVAARLEFFRFD